MPKTREQLMAERAAEIGWQRQMEAAHAAEAAERERAHNELMQRVEKRREAIDSFIKHSWAQRSDEPMTQAQYARVSAEIEAAALEQAKASGDIPTLEGYFGGKRAEDIAAAAQAEAARIAALTPREVWLSTLTFADRSYIGRWEAVNKQPWPGSPQGG